MQLMKTNNKYDERKQTVRRKIRPENLKSLWESVKIARDGDNCPTPTEIHRNDEKFIGSEIPEAEFFRGKVEDMN